MNKNSSGSTGGNSNTRQISPSKNWCFTFNNHTSSIHLKMFHKLCNSSSKRYVFQEEKGDSGTLHLQGFIEFTKKVRPISIFKGYPTIHWEKCRNIKASILYCSDPEKRLENGEIWRKGIKEPYVLKCLHEDQLYAWQKTMLDIVKETCDDDRTIHWLWERKGNVGKSAFCKYLCINHNAIILSGKGTDMYHGVITMKDKSGSYPEIIILDIPRTIQDYVSFAGIENLKNGCFFSGKYEGGMVLMNSPHIICFANSRPDERKFSQDRWRIRRIVDNELIQDRL